MRPLRYWLLSVLLLPLNFPSASAEGPAMVGVATSDIASGLSSEWLSQAHVALLEYDKASDTEVNRRAWAMRDAKVFIYSSKQESILGAMYRERLMMQGVPVVDVESRKTPALRREQSPQSLGGLVTVLAQP
jgi:hypothetical protein